MSQFVKAHFVKTIAAAMLMLASAGGAFAQSSTNSQMHPAQVAKGAKAATPGLMSEFTGQLPPALVAQLDLKKEQMDKLEAAQIARHSLWASSRRARQSEYDLIAKELEEDKFDPREIIKLRKKIRQEADKRMDDVQNAWLVFWDSLNETQRKLLVSYIKSQHRKLAKVPDPAAPKAAQPTK